MITNNSLFFSPHGVSKITYFGIFSEFLLLLLKVGTVEFQLTESIGTRPYSDNQKFG